MTAGLSPLEETSQRQQRNKKWVLGGRTEPPEARRRDPRETSDSSPRPALPKASIISAGTSPTSLGFIHGPAAPHTGLGEHRQPSPYSGSSRGGSGTGFQPPLVPGPSLSCSCSSRRLPRLRHPVSSWETFLVSDRPRSHSHGEGEAGREGGPALWDTRVVAWSAEGHSCRGLIPALSGLPGAKTHSPPAAREFPGVVCSCPTPLSL